MDKVETLAKEVDNLTNTFMTDVIARFLLRHYYRYEHRLDTHSELVRDWAIHGPLGKWAAELLGVESVRLYNAEKIYHAGSPCQPAWHRDTVAAPFLPHRKSITFNIYLDGISGDSDALIFIKKSHTDLTRPPTSVDKETNNELSELTIRVGDVLAHDPRIYHTPSGKGCWHRRSL